MGTLTLLGSILLKIGGQNAENKIYYLLGADFNSNKL